jgi:NADPH-dependent 2,4-dienoyl-CoA reductase/sulfur reductase-like enzyme
MWVIKRSGMCCSPLRVVGGSVMFDGIRASSLGLNLGAAINWGKSIVGMPRIRLVDDTASEGSGYPCNGYPASRQVISPEPIRMVSFSASDRPEDHPSRFSQQESMMTSVQSVLVVGGGFAGCALAALLGRGGVDVEIVERKEDFTGSGIAGAPTGRVVG